MSFKLFEIEFDGKKDSFEVGKEKMDKVCQIVGEKFISGWIEYGDKNKLIDKDNVNHLFGWLKRLEECELDNLNEEKINAN
jgi:hypothetical protein